MKGRRKGYRNVKDMVILKVRGESSEELEFGLDFEICRVFVRVE